ncbi:MAG: hypothetical protein AAF297_08255 [Planctomycetota bacterium]
MRRAMVLLAVLLVVTMSALIGTTLIVSVAAERVLIEGGLRRGESRAAALSGVRAAMSELALQRDTLIGGSDPELTESWAASESGSERLVVRLVELPGGGLARSEASLLDANRASEAVLGGVRGLDADAVSAVVNQRSAGLFSSVDEFARDATLAALLDPVVETGRVRGGDALAGLDTFDGSGGAWGGDTVGLAGRAFTVFAFDPQVTSGLDGVEAGVPRVVVNGPWSESVQADLEVVLGEPLGRSIGGTMEAGELPESMAALLAAIASEPLSAEDLGRLVDGIAFSADPFALGRVDINRADGVVLEALCGLIESADGATLAGSLVAARERLGVEQLRSPAWPLSSGELTREQYAVLAPYITTRSLVWRVRVEAGFESVDVDGGQVSLPESDEFGVAIDTGSDGTPEGGSLRHRVVYEAVIDVSAARPRVAYLRDVTSLEIMSAKRAAALSAAAEGGPRRLVRQDRSLGGDGADAGGVGESSFMTRATPGATSRERDRWELGAMAEEASRGRDRTNEGETGAGGQPGRAGVARDGGGGVGEPSAGVDRRVGRWTAGGLNGSGGG